ncbi:MAG: type II toxin-antitoxin system HicA family toxin [Chloroflexi bacterium]|nr:type II toxin-antitoxin system HicA family toxin [Chloroflexota bacterium]
MNRRNYDLRRMLAGAGNVRSRDLRRALEERGWVHVRTEGGHHYYKNGPHRLSVPQRLRGTGTVRRLIRTALQVEEQSDG